MNLVYKNNVEALEHKYNYFITKNSYEVNYTFEIIKSKDGSSSLLHQTGNQKLFLNSKYSPVKEAITIVKTIDFPKTKLILVFGFGLGYLMQEIAKYMNPETKVIIVEPSEAIFNKSIEIFNYKEIIKNNNIFIIVGGISILNDTLKRNVSYEDILSMQIITSNNYDKAFNQEYEFFLSIIEEVELEYKSTIHTLCHFSDIWERNIVSNILALLDSDDVSVLTNVYKDIPILVISAGPSLNRNIDLIKLIETKAIIICVGTALKPLLSVGITPDYIVSIDGGEINFQHFKDTNYGNSNLVFNPKVFAEVTRKHQGQKYRFCNDDAVLKGILDGFDIQVSSLNGENSVSTFALDLAIKMGGAPIILIGQDLAYTENNTHAAKTIYGNDQIGGNQSVITLLNMYGEKVNTSNKFLEVKRSLEDIIYVNKPLFINASEGGLSIKGTENMSLREVINKYIKAEVPILNKKVVNNDSTTDISKEKVNSINEKLVNYKEILKTVNHIAHELLTIQNKSNRHIMVDKMIVLNNELRVQIDKLFIFNYSLRAIYYKNVRENFDEIISLRNVYSELTIRIPKMVNTIEKTLELLKYNLK